MAARAPRLSAAGESVTEFAGHDGTSARERSVVFLEALDLAMALTPRRDAAHGGQRGGNRRDIGQFSFDRRLADVRIVRGAEAAIA